MKNLISKPIVEVGNYTMLMGKVFRIPISFRSFVKQLLREMINYGVNSIGIVLIISFFIGTVLTIQLAYNMSSPLIPRFTIGYAAREVIILEFSSSIMCLILSGKVGSSIASELATMRVTEQIDAMEIMGINSANFLILPKVVGLILFIPVLAILSMTIAIGGGYLSSYFITNLTPSDYIQGIQIFFAPKNIGFSIIKTLVYAFIISSGSAYHGYTVRGGALQVGQASTRAVVTNSILILLADALLTNLFLL